MKASQAIGCHSHAGNRRFVGKIGLFSLVILWAPACATNRLPDGLSSAQARLIDGARYDCIVAVEPHVPPIYSESLYQALSKTGMFKQVIIRSEARTYDVVARVSEEVYGTPTIPVVAILTLGIIPSIVPERIGLRFSLENVAASSSMKVDATYSSDAYLGWITLPMMLFPSYSCGDPRSSRRYLDFLRFRISETSESVLRGFRK